MPYPTKTVVSATHVVRFVKPHVRYAYEHGDGLALSIDSSGYNHHYEGKDTLFWWHPSFTEFEPESQDVAMPLINEMSFHHVQELTKMNEFLNDAYNKGLITLIPFLTAEDEGKYFVQVEDRFTYHHLADTYFL